MPTTDATYIPVAGGELHYQVTTGQGDNPIPLVLIHAGVADLRMWDAQIDALMPRCTIIRHDTRNFGLTRTTDATVAYSNRQDVRDLLDHLSIPKAVIAGCSRGGQIAVDFALESPERVLGLIPICAGLSGFDYAALQTPPEEVAAFAQLEALGDALSAADPTARAGMAEQIARAEAEVWINGLYRPDAKRASQTVYDYVYAICLAQAAREPLGTVIPLDPPAAGRLSEISVPTLVVVGAYDVKETLAVADFTAAHIAGAEKLVIDDAAHLPSMEQPDAFNAAVLRFLERVTL